jgi:hypothetical protein
LYDAHLVYSVLATIESRLNSSGKIWTFVLTRTIPLIFEDESGSSL